MHLLKDAGQSKMAEEIIRGTKIGSSMSNRQDEEVAFDMFGEVYEFVSAARDLYTDGKLSWDKAMDELSTLVLRLKGKEKVLKKAAKDEVGEDEKESESVE